MNIKFNYLYRDGANYKQHHAEIFSNTKGWSLIEIDVAIRSALIGEEWFYADKWKLKDLHLYAWDQEIDHSWHEYDCIEETKEDATSGDISDFISLIQNVIEGDGLNSNTKLIGLINRLNELFQTNPIVLYVKEEIQGLESLLPLRRMVFMDSDILENNLRMIESYLPEMLAAFSIVSDREASINEVIHRLSNNKFPDPKASHSKILLQLKIVFFLEAILFADFFNVVWNGEVSVNRCYMYTEGVTVQYYQHHQIRPLLIKLLDRIHVMSENTIDEGILRMKFRFLIL